MESYVHQRVTRVVGGSTERKYFIILKLMSARSELPFVPEIPIVLHVFISHHVNCPDQPKPKNPVTFELDSVFLELNQNTIKTTKWFILINSTELDQ